MTWFGGVEPCIQNLITWQKIMQFEITSNTQGMLEEIRDFSSRRLKAAIATAMTRTALRIRADIASLMSKSLDRPKEYTLRQLRYVGATAEKPVAAIGFNIVAITDVHGKVLKYKDLGPKSTPAGNYLSPQIDGGTRRAKSFEAALRYRGVLPAGWYAVPGAAAELDAHGNHTAGEIKKILSWFDAASIVDGSEQNKREKGRKKAMRGTKTRHGYMYFAVSPYERAFRSYVRASGKKGYKALKPGIYRSRFTAFGKTLEPLMIFVRSVSYSKKFDFYGEGQRLAPKYMDEELRRSVSESASRMRAK